MTNLPDDFLAAINNPSETESDSSATESNLSIGEWARLQRLKASDEGKLPIEGVTLGNKIENLFRQTVLIPVAEISYPLLAAYAAIPSTLCDILPILELRGDPESGKSECMKVFAEVTGSKLKARSTAASIKNDLNAYRWADGSTLSIEKNCFYLCDNSDADFFNDRDAMTAFLNGYDRKTDEQSISNGKGENIVFRVFAPKVISTVWRIESPEVRRRCLTIKFKAKTDIEHLIPMDDLAIGELRKELTAFWGTPGNWELFKLNQVTIRRQFPKSFPRQQWKLVADVINAGLMIGVWVDLPTAFNFFEAYFESRKNAKEGIYETLLQIALDELSGVKSMGDALPPGSKLIIDPFKLKQAMEAHSDAGLIPKIKSDKLQQDIRQLGWQVVNKGGAYVYQRITSKSK
ncbi:hypothetical protein [Chroococcidiopsis sp.]|uniref:hypothetical protein n=1 Tax=Chroococcidiopsis sp. TaxID=3088168 RepID=UPI003F335010